MLKYICMALDVLVIFMSLYIIVKVIQTHKEE